VFITETSRDCPMPVNLEATLDAQTWIWAKQFERELFALAKAPDFIVMDRCVVDPAA